MFKYFLILLLLTLTISSCKKQEIAREVSVLTGSCQDLQPDKVTLTGQVLDNGAGIDQYGHCWDTLPDPTLVNHYTKINTLNQQRKFTSIATHLIQNKKYYYRTYAISSSITVFGECKEFTTKAFGLPEIELLGITDLTDSSALVLSKIYDLGEGIDSITKYGHCWSTDEMPDINDSLTLFAPINDTISYRSEIKHLQPATEYFVRSYAINNTGIGYSDINSFRTQNGYASLKLIIHKNTITSNSISTFTTITHSGGLPVTSKGLCWDTIPNPNINSNCVYQTNVGNSYTRILDLLEGGEIYYVKAFAITDFGIAYSNEENFTTLQATLPTVFTTAPYNFSSNSIDFNPFYQDDGGAKITKLGICWSTNPSPTINNNYINQLPEVNSNISFITVPDLTSLQKYYFRAYAVNDVGLVYGDEVYLKLPLSFHEFRVQTNTINNMGSTEGNLHEQAVHYIQVNPFQIGTYEVTNIQFCNFLNSVDALPDGSLNGERIIDINNNSEINYSNGVFNTSKGDFPVRFVSWVGANAFSEWVGGRLPSEAEWELCARGRIDFAVTYSGWSDINDVAWYNANSENKTHQATLKNANTIGQYDMSGNVREWCSDWYDSGYYSISPTNNPQGPETGTYKVVRGGSYLTGEEKCRIYARDYASPDTCYADIGFRVVLPLD